MSEPVLPNMPLDAACEAAGEQELLPRPVRTATIPKKGQRATISLSDDEKQALCLFYDLQEIKHFETKVFLEKRTTTKFRLTGTVKAEVVQTCVLSLKPVRTLMEEEIDLTLVPASEFEKHMERTDEQGLLVLGLDADVPDTYDHEKIDLGIYVLEHFALGLDPYPRAEDAKLDESAVADDGEASAFAGLAALKATMKPDESGQ